MNDGSFEIIVASEYFLKSENKEIDWNETGDKNLISMMQHNKLQNILTCEASIFLLRGSAEFGGELADDMVSIRRNFINEYEKDYGKYIEYNDFS
jgi:hypothetical protein